MPKQSKILRLCPCLQASHGPTLPLHAPLLLACPNLTDSNLPGSPHPSIPPLIHAVSHTVSSAAFHPTHCHMGLQTTGRRIILTGTLKTADGRRRLGGKSGSLATGRLCRPPHPSSFLFLRALLSVFTCLYRLEFKKQNGNSISRKSSLRLCFVFLFCLSGDHAWGVEQPVRKEKKRTRTQNEGTPRGHVNTVE